MSTDAAALKDRLQARGWTLAVAESLTGGLLASALVDVPGVSAVFRGGVVSYATAVKASLLGVDEALLEAEGAVHPEVARQMAAGVRDATAVDGDRTDVGIATTGVAGPDPQDGQPVGTVFIAVSTPAGDSVARLDLRGDRSQVRRQAVQHALALALEAV